MPTDIDTLLQSVFGFETFREGQREVIEKLLGNGHAQAVFPTGGGKSLCYQLPALALEGTTIVVSPFARDLIFHARLRSSPLRVDQII